MQTFPQIAKTLDMIRIRDINTQLNEYIGYQFRNINGEVSAVIAHNSNAQLAFYSPNDDEDFNGGFRWFNGNTEQREIVMTLDGSGNLDCIGDIAGFNSSLSDSNFKENIRPYTDWKHAIDNLKPVQFTWKEDAPLENKRGTEDIGLIAQEVARAYPLAHDTRQLGEKNVEIVKYEKLVPVLIAAIRDLEQRVKELESKN